MSLSVDSEPYTFLFSIVFVFHSIIIIIPDVKRERIHEKAIYCIRVYVHTFCIAI